MSTTLPASVPQDVPVGSTQQIGAPAVTQSILLLAANAGQLNGLGPTPAQISGGIPLYTNSDPSALTNLLDGALVAGTDSNAGKWYTSDGSGAPIKWMENGVITAAVSLASPVLASNGAVGAPSISFTNSATTGFYRSAADTIGIAVAGALDFDIAANLLTAKSGSVIATNTISETTAASGVTIDGLLIKDSGIGAAFTVAGAVTAAGLVNTGTYISGVRSVQSIADNGTILLPTAGENAIVATSTAGDKTGVIITAGATTGQKLVLINTSGNSLTMAAAGTSNVSNGASCVLPALQAMSLVWEAGAARWFPARA